MARRRRVQAGRQADEARHAAYASVFLRVRESGARETSPQLFLLQCVFGRYVIVCYLTVICCVALAHAKLYRVSGRKGSEWYRWTMECSVPQMRLEENAPSVITRTVIRCNLYNHVYCCSRNSYTRVLVATVKRPHSVTSSS